MSMFEPSRYETGHPMLLGGLRRHHTFAESGRGIPEQWQQFRSLGEIPGQLGTTVYGALCGADASGFEYLCGIEVESFAALSGDLGRMRILEQQYAVFLHPEHVSEIRTTWEGILNEWLPKSDYQSAQRPDFEVYDQEFDPLTGLGGVEIWLAIAR